MKKDFPFLTDSQFFVDAPLKLKSPYFLLNKNKNFSKNKTESKMENPTQIFREVMNLVLQFTCKWWIKNKTAMSWSSQEKKSVFFNHTSE